uniref:Uncharacterized protein n=1 Tax=Utricularia reniformis TaxID=192314 RepID=A0A1Y0B1F3_9LAMI|nr:hypothetical protein AEK19_MT1049 [Utricularia reniformis]ART31272.1 hypothetical protein AEK19_MT1049 [Utricularia reniformis]
MEEVSGLGPFEILHSSFLLYSFFRVGLFPSFAGLNDRKRMAMSHMSVAVNMTARPDRRTFFLLGI